MELEKLTAEEAQSALHGPSVFVSRPDLNGLRLKHPVNPAVYLIDRGQKRWIPNPGTYTILFKDWNGILIYPDIDNIDTGPTLTSGACLVKGDGSDPVYLVDNNVKRWITSPEVFNRYYFDWGKIRTVAQIIVDSIPTGDNIAS